MRAHLHGLPAIAAIAAGCSAPPNPPAVAIETPPAAAPEPVATATPSAQPDAGPKPENADDPIARLHARACEADNSGYPAIVAAYKREHPEPDAQSTFAEDKQRCDSGDACQRLAYDYENGIGVAKSPARAAALYKIDCEQQRGFSTQACWSFADYLAAGIGVPRDTKRAVSLYEFVCPNGMYGACLPLADLVRAGDGAPRDEAHAFAVEGTFASMSNECCLNGFDSSCCASVARAHREGRGRAKDEERARSAEFRAAVVAEAECGRGLAQRCVDLAERYAWGRGVPSDGDCAKRLFAQACAGGHAPACTLSWPSPMPTDAEWNSMGEVVVKHSTALGCETKMVREWLRVRCTSKDAANAPVDGRFVRGESAVESSAERGGGVVTLLTSVRAGADLEARVVWPKTGIRTLRITWPKGAASPTMGFDKGR